MSAFLDKYTFRTKMQKNVQNYPEKLRKMCKNRIEKPGKMCWDTFHKIEKGYRKDGDITNIPLYLAGKMRELL